MTQVFSDDFVAGLPEMNRFENPVVVRLCKDTMESNVRMRGAIERWFAKVPENIQAGMLARLRSQEDSEHLSAFFELALMEHFETAGFVVDRAPILEDGTTPDMKLSLGGQIVYVEVRTIAEEEKSRINRKRKNSALVQLDKISSKYILSIYFEKEPEEAIKPTQLRQSVADWLSQASIPEGERLSEAFKAGGYEVEVTANNRPEYGEGPGRVMFNSGPVGFLGTSLGLMYRGMKEKGKKYKNLQEGGKPYVVAICSTDLNYALEDLWMMLATYGSLLGEENDGGYLNLSGEKPKHAGVSGLLHCKLLYDRENFGFDINFFENPSAVNPIPEEFQWKRKEKETSDLSRENR
ncbi:MAG TPA: hypothetical protein V6C86_22985 [Oculatellaceae cyanobacterium]